MHTFLDGFPLWVVLAGTVLLFFAAIELGYRLGRRADGPAKEALKT